MQHRRNATHIAALATHSAAQPNLALELSIVSTVSLFTRTSLTCTAICCNITQHFAIICNIFAKLCSLLQFFASRCTISAMTEIASPAFHIIAPAASSHAASPHPHMQHLLAFCLQQPNPAFEISISSTAPLLHTRTLPHAPRQQS